MPDTSMTAEPEVAYSDIAPAGTPPHVAVAPGLLDQKHVVLREDDDTDEDYQARCDLLAAVLAFARNN